MKHHDSFGETIRRMVRSGWRVESMGTKTAVLVKGRRVNHILHLLLTLVTLGLWAVVWLLLVAMKGEQRKTVFVDPQSGYVRVS